VPPCVLRFADNMLKNYFVQNFIIPASVFLLFLLLRKPVCRFIFLPMLKIGGRTGASWPKNMKDGFEKPLRALLVIIGAFTALGMSPAVLGSGAWPAVVKCFRSLLIFIAAWGFYRMAGRENVTNSVIAKKLDINENSAVVPVISSVERFIVVALAILIIAQEWNYSISGLVAGLGLGGLAFALAAQDMLSNLFGGLVIVLDKPFVIGDWITVGDIEGTVEAMNFRSVRIRTFSQALVTMPNSKIADSAVTNFSRMGKRRVNFNIGLKYGTASARIKACTEKIRCMLLADGDIDGETVTVALDGFGESSMDIMLQFFTVTTDWQKYLEVKEKVMFSIMDILESENVETAFPTRTLHIEKS